MAWSDWSRSRRATLLTATGIITVVIVVLVVDLVVLPTGGGRRSGHPPALGAGAPPLPPGSISAGAQPVSSPGYVPGDAGLLDVRSFGAVGDGRTDDTAALQRAISSNIGTRAGVVYLPAGTYLVSSTLLWKATSGKWSNMVSLVGQGAGFTTIRLVDHAAGFADRKYPRPLIETGTKAASPTGGGNEAFNNLLSGFTVDTGAGNPGAVGIDYLGNNRARVHDVAVRSPDGSGAVGISMTRSWPGPCLLDEVTVSGFAIGIDVGTFQYGVTLSHVEVDGATTAALRDSTNVLAADNLRTNGPGPAIQETSPLGMVTLVEASLQSTAVTGSAIQGGGHTLLRDVTRQGYAGLVAGASSLPAVQTSLWSSDPSSTVPSSPAPPAVLAPADPPPLLDNNPKDWMSVRAFGASGDGKTDDTAALQRAMAANVAVLYFPIGVYKVSATLHLGGSIGWVEGFGSELRAVNGAFTAGAPVLQIEQGAGAPVTIHNLDTSAYSGSSPPSVSILQASTRAFSIQDSILRDGVAYQGMPGATTFLSDTVGGAFHFSNGQRVWARQLDTESDTVKITNAGAQLWVLGLKTENINAPLIGDPIVVDTSQGGVTNVFGGFLYPVRPVDPSVPAFRFSDGSGLLNFVVTAYASNERYGTEVACPRAECSLPAARASGRGLGHVVTEALV